MKRIAILGSTGSIGTQALDIIREHSEEYEAYILTANNSVEKLIEQAREFQPECVVIANEAHYDTVAKALEDLPIKVFAGAEALCQVVQMEDVDIVLTAMVGFSGLRPTIAAIEAKKTIALANKETLVVAGELITALAAKHQVAILPVDSEHSAIFQSITGEAFPEFDTNGQLTGYRPNRISRIILTASGGPFRKYTLEEMKDVTAAQALKHPNWEMGAKITIDSATMMNKGFEMIEAKWLFGVRPEQIDVHVHPESIVHSAVEFEDGGVKAQLGVPDMRLPIQYAFSYPQRLSLSGERLDLFAAGALHFERPDMEKFDCLKIAYEAAECGGNMPCIVNAANEIVNLAFRKGRIGYLDIARLIRRAMTEARFIEHPTLQDYLDNDAEVRQLVEGWL
ncbi:MAG: 1-deoxy-D-xylulose-5-phosphate reductoisomerase [Bacteroidales bacterium]|nr:1-deoxy-D-xylulose-5-phosphate reductoisomerase [Bacteroidales bacterium]